MKFLLVLVVIFIGFTFEVNAQLCGRYTTTLFVKTKANESLEKINVKLKSLGKNKLNGKKFVRDKNDFSKFFITFDEGHIVKGTYKLIVSAKEFLVGEREIKFPHCENQTIEILLKR